jgi:hypothetical protein
MKEQYIALVQGGDDQPRACGPFNSNEQAEYWLTQQYGDLDKMDDAKKNYLQPQVIRIESPDEF